MGMEKKICPVYFNQDPVFAVAAAGGIGGGRGGPVEAGPGQMVTPNAAPVQVAPYEANPALPPSPVLGGAGPVTGAAGPGRGGRGGAPAAAGSSATAGPVDSAPGVVAVAGAGRGGRGGGGGRGGNPDAPQAPRPRVVMQFPANAGEMLLSGTLNGGEALANRALAIDMPVGKGHVVMFALRPFWRWQTQGTYFLAFNAILNWDHLDAGKAPATAAAEVTGN